MERGFITSNILYNMTFGCLKICGPQNYWFPFGFPLKTPQQGHPPKMTHTV